MNIPQLISQFGLSTLFIHNTTDTTIYLSNYSLLFTVNKLNKWRAQTLHKRTKNNCSHSFFCFV